jgi:hypothetical protein
MWFAGFAVLIVSALVAGYLALAHALRDFLRRPDDSAGDSFQ